MNLQLPAYGSCEHMFPGLGYIKIKMVYDKKRSGKKKQKQTNRLWRSEKENIRNRHIREKPYLNNNSTKISFNSVKLQKKSGGPADHVPMVNVFQIHKLCNH